MPATTSIEIQAAKEHEQAPTSMMSSLAKDIFSEIIQYLNLSDLYSLSLTEKKYYQRVKEELYREVSVAATKYSECLYFYSDKFIIRYKSNPNHKPNLLRGLENKGEITQFEAGFDFEVVLTKSNRLFITSSVLENGKYNDIFKETNFFDDKSPIKKLWGGSESIFVLLEDGTFYDTHSGSKYSSWREITELKDEGNIEQVQVGRTFIAILMDTNKLFIRGEMKEYSYKGTERNHDLDNKDVKFEEYANIASQGEISKIYADKCQLIVEIKGKKFIILNEDVKLSPDSDYVINSRSSFAELNKIFDKGKIEQLYIAADRIVYFNKKKEVFEASRQTEQAISKPLLSYRFLKSSYFIKRAIPNKNYKANKVFLTSNTTTIFSEDNKVFQTSEISCKTKKECAFEDVSNRYPSFKLKK